MRLPLPESEIPGGNFIFRATRTRMSGGKWASPCERLKFLVLTYHANPRTIVAPAPDTRQRPTLATNHMNGKLKVMLVDDGEDAIMLLEQAVKRTTPKWHVQTFQRGELALQCLEGTGVFNDRKQYPTPDVILLDLKMPAVDGFEVLRCIKTRPRSQHIVVVVFSASADRGDINRCYALGANSYLVKPVAFNDLCKLVALLDAFWRERNMFARPEIASDPVC